MTARRTLPPGELPRKAVHLGMAAFALALRWLDWRAAALCALVAFLFNLLLLPRLLGHRLATKRHGASDRGVLLYPLVVLALIVLFHRPGASGLALAAFGWGLLAGGDAVAGTVGMLWGRHPLPWNGAKSWEGFTGYVLGGGALGVALFAFVWGRCPYGAYGTAAAVAVVLGTVLAAVLESLPHGLDDNVLPPLAGTLVLAAATAGTAGLTDPPALARAVALAAAVNLAIAVAARAVRLLEGPGIAAAWLLGTVTLGFGTWRAYLLLWIFLAGGTAVTRIRRAEKRRAGLEDERRRGLAHVAANGALCLVGSVLYGLTGSAAAAAVVAAGLAAALADTAASEIGKAYGRRTWALPSLRPVPPGTEGAVSIPGTLAGLAGAAAIAGAAVASGFLPAGALLPVTAAGFLAMLAEGFLPRLGPVTNTGTNLANTVTGALILHAITLLLPP